MTLALPVLMPISASDLATCPPPSPALTTAIGGWLHEKQGRTGSQRTAHTYASTLASYRAQLLVRQLDLDSGPQHARDLALTAQAWAALSTDGSEVKPATYNQRLAIISSFFAYAVPLGLVPDGNPIASFVKRRRVQDYGSAQPLRAEDVRSGLAAIDRSTLAGLRDYALLSVLLSTGRRLSELAGLRWGDVQLDGERITCTWRCKGGKVLRDTLGKAVAATLHSYLNTCYGAQLATLGPDAPIWVVLAAHGRGGPLSIQSIADVCFKHLGVSKVHALRHTFAHTMQQRGGSLTEIQQRLGHDNAATTSRYLQALASAENRLADAVADAFGIG